MDNSSRMKNFELENRLGVRLSVKGCHSISLLLLLGRVVQSYSIRSLVLSPPLLHNEVSLFTPTLPNHFSFILSFSRSILHSSAKERSHNPPVMTFISSKANFTPVSTPPPKGKSRKFRELVQDVFGSF